MRSVFRSVLVALVAVFAMGAVAASGASAHNFVVEGKTLTGEEAYTGSSATAKFVWDLGGTEVKFECTKEASSGHLLGEGKFTPGTPTFTGCVITNVPGCSLNSPLKMTVQGQLTSLGTGLGLQFTGSGPSEEIIKFTVTGGSCPIPPAQYKVVGHWICELHEAGVEAAEHEEVCKTVNSHMHVGEGRFTVAYTEKLKLVSGKKWSAV